MAFLGTNGLAIDEGRLLLDGVELPLSAKGDVFVDFSSPAAYYTAHKRVAKLLADAEAGQPIASVDEGDFVLILPAMYTGHGDFTQTPIGDLPGGFVIATLLSSRLRGRWLSMSDLQLFVDGAAVTLGALAGLVSGALYAPVLLAALGAWLALCVYVFVWHGSIVALGSSSLALAATALALLAMRGRLRERLILILKLLKRENEELQLELSQAADIARVLLPAKVPEWPGVSIGAFHRSLTDTSGDWFAFERAPSGGYLHFVLCDISGHGAQAAIIVSTCKAVLSMLVETDARLLERADFLPLYATHLNRTLCRNGSGSHTTTLLGLSFDLAAEKVHCICAAHPQPLHFQGDDASGLRPIGKVNNLLGVSLDHSFTAKSYDLRPGDNLVAFTDGVLLPRRLDQIRATFHRYAHHTPEAAARYAALEGWEAKTHASGARINDDISLIWLRYQGKTAGALAKARKAS
jgi:serine phosphatase RsbU (regulator of sigma subunit)